VLLCCVQDKAIKRFSVRNIVEAGAMNDLKLACFYEGACECVHTLARG
jgi:ribosomal protein S26